MVSGRRRKTPKENPVTVLREETRTFDQSTKRRGDTEETVEKKGPKGLRRTQREERQQQKRRSVETIGLGKDVMIT